jgi:hypothetical protein
VEPNTNVVEATPSVISFVTSTGHIGDYQLHMRMCVANPVMVYVYMGVALPSLRAMFTKYDHTNDDIDDHDNDANHRTPTAANARTGIRARGKSSTTPSGGMETKASVMMRAPTGGENGIDETKVAIGANSPLFGTSEYLYTHSIMVTPTSSAMNDMSMILPRDWFVRCLSSFELGVRHPLIIHICPLAESSSTQTNNRHHSIVNTPITARSTMTGSMPVLSLQTPSGLAPGSLANSRPITPTRPSDPAATIDGRASPPSTPLGWDSPHATASELIIVTFPPLPPPPSATSPRAPVSPSAAAAPATTTAQTNTNNDNTSAAIPAALASTSDGSDEGKTAASLSSSTVEQVAPNSLDLLVSRAKFERQLLLADGLLYDVQVYHSNDVQ